MGKFGEELIESIQQAAAHAPPKSGRNLDGRRRTQCQMRSSQVRLALLFGHTNVVTINRPEVVALIEEAANKLTDGNKTEAVALALRRLLEETARAGSLFGVHRGSVRVHEGVDVVAPALDVEPDAETGREIER